MSERIVSIISTVAIINLIVTSLVCWFKSKNYRFYFWLAWLIFSAAVAMINNLSIFYGNGNIWVYHVALFLNISSGAYLILFIQNHTKKTNCKRTRNLILFLPSLLYVPFIFLCLVDPAWATKTIELAQNGELTILGILYNLIIVFYSVGANVWLFVRELRSKKIEFEISNRKQRIEILGVMLVLQLLAFIPFLLKLDIVFIIIYMPLFGQIYFLYLFLRMWKLERISSGTVEKSLIATSNNAFKYATIKLSDEKISDIICRINVALQKEKLYLIPEFSLTELAQKTGVPVNLLSMVINSQLHTTFPDLVNRYRIERAKELLPDMKKNKTTIETIAYDCGFCNRTSFYTAFHKFANCSPSQFIQDLKKGNLSVE